jgi:hypothetical protein
MTNKEPEPQDKNNIGVVNNYCRLCGRLLTDESDLWAGRCNNDVACQKRRRERDAL